MTKPNDGPAVQPADSRDVAALLGEDAVRPWWRRPSTWITAVLALVLAAAAWFWQGRRTEAGPGYVTQPVDRGSLMVTVAANGTLQPTRAVNVGSELSGTVARVLVDINDRVTKGQVLAELDTAKLGDQVRRSRAALASAEARVAQADATVREARASLGRMEEVARLSGGKVPSQAELDAGRAALDRAQADVRVAQATVADARAALSVDETNLRKASIRSPIDGVVLTRSVDPGNAVAASLQAVTLFNIAEDLTKMKLQVNIDEADVGQVAEGQSASFTVSAWPGRRYPARVLRLGYGATTQDNVVTYLADLEVDNEDLSLRPGMTASATIASTERSDVLLVPNAALRFRPAAAAAGAGDGQDAGGGSGNSAGGASGSGGGSGGGAAGGGAGGGAGAPGSEAVNRQASGGLVSQLMPRMVRGTSARRGGEGPAGARQVWVLRDGQPVMVEVTPGATDGRFTEIVSGKLAVGDLVITEQTAGARR